MPFLIIFLAIPFLEIMVFMAVGDKIGLGATLFLALMTAIIGGLIVRYQGMITLIAARNALNAGRMPMDALFDGICLVAAGALLITPGFVTDTIGFALLVPGVRSALRTIIAKHTQMEAEPAKPRQPDVIEGDYERVDEE